MSTTQQPAAYTPDEIENAVYARKFVHKATCPNPRHTTSCAACPTPRGVLDALRVLAANPRDARGARLALHDAVCQSGCSLSGDTTHADSTQARPAAALRRFRAMRAAAPGHECTVCHERIVRVDPASTDPSVLLTWVHVHSGAVNCGTGDGSVACPPRTLDHDGWPLGLHGPALPAKAEALGGER
jgi:hypothetical protein